MAVDTGHDEEAREHNRSHDDLVGGAQELPANEAFLGALMWARVEYNSRADQHTDTQRPRQFALLLAIQSELVGTAAVLAACCGVANAIAMGEAGARLRHLIRNLPQPSSRLTIAATRLRRIEDYLPVAKALDAFHETMAQAMQATIETMLEGEPAPASAPALQLANRWREACGSALRLLNRQAEALSSFGLTLANDPGEPLHAALNAAAAGNAHPLGAEYELSANTSENKRRSRRIDVAGRVIMVAHGQQCESALHDISAGGVGVSDPIGLTGGEAIVVIVDDTIHMGGRVAWAARGNAGIEFEQPLYDDAPELKFLAVPAVRRG